MRPLARKDLAFAGSLHVRSLPHGLFPRLGEPFLRRYYSTFVRSPWGIGLVVESEGRAVGVVVGTVDDGAHYRYVARKWWLPLAASAVASLATRPRVALWFLRTRGRRYARGFTRLVSRRRPESVSGPESVSADGAGPLRRRGVLSHVVVDEDSRGAGAGGELVAAFVEWAGRRGTTDLRLVTHPATGAAEFYRRLGWTYSGPRTGLDGAEWAEFRLELR